jgi:hypothetical protein
MLCKYCWLLVVLIEGRDFCSSNRENWSETCENGVQGVSFAGHRCVSTSSDGELSLDCRGIHTKAILTPCNKHPLRKVFVTRVPVLCMRFHYLMCIWK